jgi:hypothetical protein
MLERKDGTGSPEMSVGRLPAAKICSPLVTILYSHAQTEELTKGMDNMLLLEQRGTGKGV